MNRQLLCVALALALPLSACDPNLDHVNSVSTQVATTAKQTRIAANRIYVGAVEAGKVLVANGQLSKERYQQLARDGYAVLLKVRTGQATLSALTAVTSALLVGGK